MNNYKKITSMDEFETLHVASCESETTVSWMRGDTTVHIFTSDNTVLTKLKKCMAKNFDQWTCTEAGRDDQGYVMGYNFIAPRKAIRFTGGNERSEEQKAAASERMLAKLSTGWLPGQSGEEDVDD